MPTIVPAERIANHRLHYLNYSGPVGDNRGTVTACEVGSFSEVCPEPPRADRLAIELHGEHRQGHAEWFAGTSQWNFHWPGQ